VVANGLGRLRGSSKSDQGAFKAINQNNLPGDGARMVDIHGSSDLPS
jgi:hypothetical protein